MKPTSSELERLLRPTALYRDFLTAPDRVRQFYPVDFRAPGAWVQSAASRDYPASRRAAVVSVARVRLGPPIEELLRALEERLPISVDRGEMLERLRGAYASGSGWADAFARFAGAWAVPLGAVVFDPTDAEAKRLALPVF